MTNRHLQVFVTVAECGRMSEAAKQMYITQSSVSQSISDIEKEFDVRLFDRLSKNLYLTKTGEVFLRYAKQALYLNKEMTDFLRNETSGSQIRIGATVTVGTCVISQIVTRFKEIYPDARPEVFVANTHLLEEMLIKNELDISMVEGRINSRELVTEKAMDDKMVLICANDHPFCGRRYVQLDELAKHPLIMREKGSGTRDQIESQLNDRGLNYNVVWSSFSARAIINAVMEGHGVSVISERLVRDEFEAGMIWTCDISDMQLARSFDLAYHKNKYFSEELACFAKLCKRFGEKERNSVKNGWQETAG